MENGRYLVIILGIILALNFVNANMIAMWNGTKATIPTGWTCDSCLGDPKMDFYQAIPRIATTFCGFDGDFYCYGSSTHRHTFSSSFSAGNIFVQPSYAPPNSFNAAGLNHVHNGLNVTQTLYNSSIPPSYSELFIIYTGSANGVPTAIPAGVIIFFNSTTTPGNFSLYNAGNGLFPYGETNASLNEGQATHNHINQSIKSSGPNSLGGFSNGIKASVPTTTHTHNLGSVGWLDNVDNTPLYVNMTPIYATQDTLLPLGMIGMFNSTPSTNWQVWTSNLGYYVRMSTSTFNVTGGNANHTHASQNIGSDSANASNIYLFGSANTTGSGHTHNFNLSLSVVNNSPPATSTIFAVYSEAIANETEGRNAIEEGINNTIPSSTIYTDLEVDVRYLNGTQVRGTFDKVAFLNNQRWAFNYVTSGENFTNMANSSYHISNVWEENSLTISQIFDAVVDFINNTLI